jgi:serine/threonine-protein kinase RsbT
VGDGTIRHAIAVPDDIVAARRSGRRLAKMAGLPEAELTHVATAITEIGRNILAYAGHGEMTLRILIDDGRKGVEVIATDDGPGIADVTRALEDGYSTSREMGLGLPGARRLMDELEIDSSVGVGTTVAMRKWTH